METPEPTTTTTCRRLIIVKRSASNGSVGVSVGSGLAGCLIGRNRLSFFPVMPHTNFSSPSSAKPLRRSTQVRLPKNMGSSGWSCAPGRSTGMTGRLSFTARRNALCISSSSQGPSPSLPISTATLREFLIPCSSSCCQGMPGCNSSSSNQTWIGSPDKF